MGVKSPLHSAFFLSVKPFAVTFVGPPILFIQSIFSSFLQKQESGLTD